MSPMSLLTMPADALQVAARQADQASPHGERAERRHTQILLLAMTVLPLLGYALLRALG